MKCKDTLKIEAVYFINPSDVKSYTPFRLKRKYGEFKRTVYKSK